MACRLADNVRVRRESWGLLFYSLLRHRVTFVRSGDWLYPEHFDGMHTLKDIIEDIAGRTGAPAELIERTIPKLTDRLTGSGIIANEV